MTNQQAMASFEKEKNLKASAYTATVCVLLFIAFFFMQWTLPQIPPPDFGEGIEVNLGNSETGIGDVAPQIPGEPSATEETVSSPPKTTANASEQKVTPDEYDDGDAPSVNKTPVTKPNNKPVKEPVTVKKTTPATVTNPTPVTPKPKAAMSAKSSSPSTTGGNGADSYNKTRDQGIAGGKGDQGNPNGNPNSDSYKGNAASGNNGNGGTGGVSIRSGLTGRTIKLPSFEDEFNENAKIAVDITVDKAGNVTLAVINPRGTTTTNQGMRNIALKKARSLKLNAGTEDTQTGTIVFNFKLRG